MSQVETVALWAGIFGSVVSIVLAVIAIRFSFWVNDQATVISEKTIEAIQRIEGTVERLSQDTNGLIKVAWEKMVVPGTPTTDSGDDPADKSVIEGMVAEIREAIVKASPADTSQDMKRFERAIAGLEATMSAELRRPPANTRVSKVDEFVRAAGQVTPAGLELVRAIVGVRSGGSRHLTSKQYGLLQDGPLQRDLLQLREAGLLVPRKSPRETTPVYFPPYPLDIIRSASLLLDDTPEQIKDRVQSELKRVRYGLSKKRHLDLKPGSEAPGSFRPPSSSSTSG